MTKVMGSMLQKGVVGSVIQKVVSSVISESGSRSWTPQRIISSSAFYQDIFDFNTNKLLDKSGNANHATMIGASARTGNGSNLDYAITGILTSDIITVESGSNIPTIPSNGTLRIGAAQTVYGVTIKRGGVIWAVIPFCEPYMNENIPTISYDVSGNGHHATCATLASGNITTQNNYFYLQRYGYSLRDTNIMGWNMNNWSGDYLSYTAIFEGLSIFGTQDSHAFIRPTGDGGCIFYHDNTKTIRLRLGVAPFNHVSGKRYRIKMTIDSIVSNVVTDGFAMEYIPSIAADATPARWFTGTGDVELDGVASANNVIGFKSSGVAATTTITFRDVKVYLLKVVPALLSGTADAVGGTIEYPGSTTNWLRYGCSLQFPNTTDFKLNDQKGCWSDVIKSGLCVNGKTYLIEATETDHFGIGKIVNQEFVSNGTETLSRYNKVRELILNTAQRGLLYLDNGTVNTVTYDTFLPIRPHFQYCKKPKTVIEKYYSPDGTYPNNLEAGAGMKYYKDNDIITDIAILKRNVYLNDEGLKYINNYFYSYEQSDFAKIVFMTDALRDLDVSTIRTLFESRYLYFTNCLYKAPNIGTYPYQQILKENGHDIQVHSPEDPNNPDNFLPAYKTFKHIDYSEADLNAYYAEIMNVIPAAGYDVQHLIYPGGWSNALTDTISAKYFYSSRRANGSTKINLMPYSNYQALGSVSVDDISVEATLTLFKGYVDTAITKVNALVIFYGHTSEWSADDWTHYTELIDYIIAKTAAGEKVRIVTLSEEYNLVKKIM